MKQKFKFLKKSYLGNIHELENVDNHLLCIYSTISDNSLVEKYVHDQFTKDAIQYDMKNNFDLFRERVSDAFLEIQTRQNKKSKYRLQKAIKPVIS